MLCRIFEENADVVYGQKTDMRKEDKRFVLCRTVRLIFLFKKLETAYSVIAE